VDSEQNTGGRDENLEAIDFFAGGFNLEAYKEHPDIQTYAEESTFIRDGFPAAYASGRAWIWA